MTHYVIEVSKVDDHGTVTSGRTISEKELATCNVDMIRDIVDKLIDELRREERRVQWNNE